MNLTPKQLHVLHCVRNFRHDHGYSPTLEELARTLHVSKITILQHLRALEKRGAIHRTRYQARSIEIRDPADSTRRKLPLVGAIAAGEPIEALEERDAVDLSDMIEGKTEPFLLRVKGDSMIDEQIRDGDYVICERRADPRNGDAVIAVLENGEATLKKFYRERDGRIRLQPANPAVKPLFPAKLEIRGIVVGVMRKY